MENKRKLDAVGRLINEEYMQQAIHNNLPQSQTSYAKSIAYKDYIADFISMAQQTEYITEYEIKCTVSDFKNDFNKKEWGNSGIKKHTQLKKGASEYPNRFYFVIPEALQEKIKPLIPSHAGLIIIKQNKGWHKIKYAPLLHKDTDSRYWFRKFAFHYQFKYWALYWDTIRKKEKK